MMSLWHQQIRNQHILVKITEGLDQHAKPIQLNFAAIWFFMMEYLSRQEEMPSHFKDQTVLLLFYYYGTCTIILHITE